MTHVWSWENRLKPLFMVSLVYTFLLSLLDQGGTALVDYLLRTWFHRPGKRYRQAAIPLYRLRAALSRLWLTYPPAPLHFLKFGMTHVYCLHQQNWLNYQSWLMQV
jgi:hypothetical protein